MNPTMKRLLAFVLFGLAGYASTGIAADVDMGQLVRLAKPAILQLYPLDSSGASLGQATGFFLNSDGFALTNYHVVEGAATVMARSLNGTRYKSEGRFIRLGNLDVVLLHFEAKNTPHIPGPNASEIFEGQHIVVIGNPDGLAATVSDGIISAIRADGQLLQITAPVSPGSSGSPVLDDNGELVGIVLGTKEDEHTQNLNFAVSAKAMKSAPHYLVEARPKPAPQPGTPPLYYGEGAAALGRLNNSQMHYWPDASGAVG
jgi:serine protease Do